MNEFYQAYKEQVREFLKKECDLKNVHEIPTIQKIVLNTSVGSANDIKAALEEAKRELMAITGQMPAETRAKKSISNFKLREGMPIGAKVTLRHRRMWEFLQRLILTALPRVRDFRGVSPKGFDGNGNYTLGIADHTVFPEVELDQVSRNIGFDITIVTSTSDDKQARTLLEALGMPFSDKQRDAEGEGQEAA
jgi:large subunit ribosomal protein L5